MTELEKLMQQRSEIERRIRELKDNTRVFGSVRINKTSKRGGYIAVQTSVNSFSACLKDTMWMTTIRERTKDEVMHKIRVIITDLSELLDYLEKEDEICGS
jgi:hypothetical protein